MLIIIVQLEIIKYNTTIIINLILIIFIERESEREKEEKHTHMIYDISLSDCLVQSLNLKLHACCFFFVAIFQS